MWVKVVAILLAVAGLFGGGWYVGHHFEAIKYQSQLATLTAKSDAAAYEASEKARDVEQKHAAEVAQIESQYQQDMSDAQSKADRTIADLHAGNLRLRKEWQCPSNSSVPQAGTGSGSADDTADQRAADAAALVRIADQADAEIKALQALLKADREMIHD